MHFFCVVSCNQLGFSVHGTLQCRFTHAGRQKLYTCREVEIHTTVTHAYTCRDNGALVTMAMESPKVCY